MITPRFTTTTTDAGVVEREFLLGDLPGVLWSPDPDEGGPVVLLGHGGGLHKKAPAMLGRARRLVLGGGFRVVALDAPGHGDRPRTRTDEVELAALLRARAAGEPEGPVVTRYNADIAERALPEWQRCLDALQTLPEVGDDVPFGYYGLNMGTAIGVPLMAVEPRITAGVLGLFWPETVLDAARRITVPIEFSMQWDDEHIPRSEALRLFDAFGSAEKSLHANAGAHKAAPRFEADSAVTFLVRHLVRGRAPGASPVR